MSRRDKLVERFKDKPKDFTWDELVRLLSGCGYTEKPRGARQAVRADTFLVALHPP